MKLKAIIIPSSPSNDAICGNAKSQPRPSSALVEIFITSKIVGITIGKPRTGSKEAFLPALEEIAAINVSPEAKPRHPSSIAIANKNLS